MVSSLVSRCSGNMKCSTDTEYEWISQNPGKGPQGGKNTISSKREALQILRKKKCDWWHRSKLRRSFSSLPWDGKFGEVHSELVIFWPVKVPKALLETAMVVLSLRSLAHKELNTQMGKKWAVWGSIFVSLSQVKLTFHTPSKSGLRG